MQVVKDLMRIHFFLWHLISACTALLKIFGGYFNLALFAIYKNCQNKRTLNAVLNVKIVMNGHSYI